MDPRFLFFQGQGGEEGLRAECPGGCLDITRRKPWAGLTVLVCSRGSEGAAGTNQQLPAERG